MNFAEQGEGGERKRKEEEEEEEEFPSAEGTLSPQFTQICHLSS